MEDLNKNTARQWEREREREREGEGEGVHTTNSKIHNYTKKQHTDTTRWCVVRAVLDVGVVAFLVFWVDRRGDFRQRPVAIDCSSIPV